MNRVLSVFAFLLTMSPAFGFRQASTDSLLSKWHSVERGNLKMPDSLKARLLLDIGVALSYDTPDSAFEYYSKALALSKSGNFKQLTGDILNRVGYTNYILGNYDLALTFFVDALEIHQSMSNDMGIATSLNHISLIYETQKNFDQALKFQWRSIIHSLRSGDVNRIISN